MGYRRPVRPRTAFRVAVAAKLTRFRPGAWPDRRQIPTQGPIARIDPVSVTGRRALVVQRAIGGVANLRRGNGSAIAGLEIAEAKTRGSEVIDEVEGSAIDQRRALLIDEYLHGAIVEDLVIRLCPSLKTQATVNAIAAGRRDDDPHADGIRRGSRHELRYGAYCLLRQDDFGQMSLVPRWLPPLKLPCKAPATRRPPDSEAPNLSELKASPACRPAAPAASGGNVFQRRAAREPRRPVLVQRRFLVDGPYGAVSLSNTAPNHRCEGSGCLRLRQPGRIAGNRRLEVTGLDRGMDITQADLNLIDEMMKIPLAYGIGRAFLDQMFERRQKF